MKAVLNLVHDNEGTGPAMADPGRNSAWSECWSNSQRVHSKMGKCPLLVFGEQWPKQLNTFFAEGE